MGYALGSLITLALIGGGQFLLRKPDPPPIVLHPPPTTAPTATPAPSATPLPTPTLAPITVFVSGAVQKPGLYQLSAQARVGDAVLIAGGFATDANANLINQAEPLRDGAHVHVPSTSDPVAAQPPAGVSGEASGSVVTLENDARSIGGGLIALNTASLEELDSLPGIGPSKAQAIIDNRPYATVDDLERVPGIGPSTIEQLRSLVTVE
jgi:competence protein ComEA